MTSTVTAFGRYLDSECDLLVNAALFAAIGLYTGHWIVAALGFVGITAILERELQPGASLRGAAAGWDSSVLGRVYGLLYGSPGPPDERSSSAGCAVPTLRRARPTMDSRTIGILANLGMSTQLALLGLCVAVGHPLVFTALALRVSSSLPVSSSGMSDSSTRRGSKILDIVQLPHRWNPEEGRSITPEEWARYESHIAEIFSAFGMDLATPGTRETPRRFLQAMFDATAGYCGDPKLRPRSVGAACRGRRPS